MKTLIADFLLPFLMIRRIGTCKKLLILSSIPSIITMAILVMGQLYLWERYRSEGVLNVLWVLTLISMVSIVGWVLLGNLLLLPFIDSIIDASQKRARGSLFLPPLPFSFLRLYKEILYTCTVVCILIISFPLFFIPLVGQILGPAIAMCALSCNALAPLFERTETPFKERIRRLRRILPSTLSYGAGLWILLYIPLVNIMLLGVAQASAVDFWLRHEHDLDRKKES